MRQLKPDFLTRRHLSPEQVSTGRRQPRRGRYGWCKPHKRSIEGCDPEFQVQHRAVALRRGNGSVARGWCRAFRGRGLRLWRRTDGDGDDLALEGGCAIRGARPREADLPAVSNRPAKRLCVDNRDGLSVLRFFRFVKTMSLPPHLYKCGGKDGTAKERNEREKGPFIWRD